MIQTLSPVISNSAVAPSIHVLKFLSPGIAPNVSAGQFVNIRVNDSTQPLLRRPFSVYRVDGECIEVIFNVVGTGTSILSRKQAGDVVDILGPLGRGYSFDDGFDTALLVAGGLGVAPLPILTSRLSRAGRPVLTFLGARTVDQIVSAHLENVHRSTDDGSAGYHGTVVDHLRSFLLSEKCRKPKMFACGPNGMLRNLSLLALDLGIPCEVSLESAMACGIGICQGCVVEHTGGGKKYSLTCTEGPVYNSLAVRIT
jgi:dihydroorotate dehydrogenase electron transfer subunit